MKVGDLVRPASVHCDPERPTEMDNWVGMIIDWESGEPIVFWNERFSEELEYRDQIEVVSRNTTCIKEKKVWRSV